MESSVIIPLDLYNKLKDQSDKFESQIIKINISGSQPYFNGNLEIDLNLFVENEEGINPSIISYLNDFKDMINKEQQKGFDIKYEAEKSHIEGEINYLKNQIKKVPAFIRSCFGLDKYVITDNFIK